MGPFIAQGLTALIANLATLSAGMVFGWVSPSLPKLLNPEDENGLKITPDESSWVASIASVGCIFGQLLVSLITDRIGRKRSLIVTVLPILVNWLIVGLATSVEVLYVGRFIGGLGLGAVYSVMPMYMGEIADNKIRGGLGTVLTTLINIGMILSFSTGPWISRQMLSVVSSVPPLLFIVLSLWIPESPYFLLMKGDRQKAHESLVWLRRRNDVNEELAILEINVMEQQKSRNGFSIAELFRGRGSRKALGIIIGLLTFQQFSGVIAIQSYASLIFEDSGLTGWSDYSVIMIGLMRLIAGISVFFVVDIAGRRPILMCSALFTAFFLTCEAVFFHLKYLGYETNNVAWIPLVGVIGVEMCSVPGLGSLPYAILGELFATNVKASAVTIASVYGSALGFLVSKVYQVASEAVGTHWVFYFFGGATLTAVSFVYFFVPETKGISLQDIQDKLNSKSSNSRANPSHGPSK